MADPDWPSIVLGVSVSGLLVGGVTTRMVREARLRRRLQRENPELYAAVEAEKSAYIAAQQLNPPGEIRRPMFTSQALRRVEDRRHSFWSDIGRFLTFWRGRLV